MFSLQYTFCLHFYLINIHIVDYPDSRLSGLFIEVPTSPDKVRLYCKHVKFTEHAGTLCFFNDMTTHCAWVFGSHSVSGKPGNKDLIKIFSIWWVLDMPQGRDSFKTTLVRITCVRSTRETRLVGKTKLVRETDKRHVLVAYRVVIGAHNGLLVVIISRRFLSSLYTLVSQKRWVVWVFFHGKSCHEHTDKFQNGYTNHTISSWPVVSETWLT